jgi:hypothetical protein
LTLWAGSSVCLWRAQHLSNCHASSVSIRPVPALWASCICEIEPPHGSQIGSLGPNTGVHVAGGGTTLDPGLEDGTSKCARRLGRLGQVAFAVTDVIVFILADEWLEDGDSCVC